MNNSPFLLKKKNINFSNKPDDNAVILKSIVTYVYVSHINLSITDWVQKCTHAWSFL